MQALYVYKAAIKPGASALPGEIGKDEEHESTVNQASGHF